jgi:hypothetical protein
MAVIPEPRYFSMPSVVAVPMWHEARFELLAMGAVVEPFARRGDPLACGDGGGVADGGHQITVTARLDADDTEAVLNIVVRDALDEAGQNFLGR